MIKVSRPPCPNPQALKSDYRNHANKAALLEASFGKCAYCETFIEHDQFGDVEHIRPKATYPALKFVWENLGVVCGRCNNSKSNHFDEARIFIDPYREDPSEFISVDGALLLPKAGNVRGQYTLEVIGLNRAPLAQRRLDLLLSMARVIDRINSEQDPVLRTKAVEMLRTFGEASKEFSLCARSAVESFLDKGTDIATVTDVQT